MKPTALIIGATGLVGNHCLLQLLSTAKYAKVTALTRSALSINHPDYENVIVDFENLESFSAKIKADHIFCAIGTTMAKAGSREAFKKVDYHIPLQIARIALSNGARKYILVSAVGADATSSIFYSKVKGELENAVAAMGYQQVVILRPSFLLGNRSEVRWGERVGIAFSKALQPFFAGPLKKYAGIEADDVAMAMIAFAQKDLPGKTIAEYSEMMNVCKRP